jgi:phosphoribosylformylglycinamidine synthase
MKALILRTAGTNCDLETKYACEKVGFSAQLIHIDTLVREKDLFRDIGLFVIPGGFTYGDDIGAGKVLANELRYKLMGELVDFVKRGGLILGICNGFQVLVKSGLLPDPFEGVQKVTLTYNSSGKFEARWVYLKICSDKSEFIKRGADIIELPVAHGEGRFVTKDPKIMEELLYNRQVILKYVGPDGKKAGYPYNPNGSEEDVAGICDRTGRILGLMPHPERFIDPLQHPRWTREVPKRIDGITFFENAARYVKERFKNR